MPKHSEVDDLVATYIEQLAQAKNQHISDLRVLLDKAAERETALAGMVRMVMEERFYRPVITNKPTENRQAPAIALEHLQDVSTFDEAADREQIREHDQASKELGELWQEQFGQKPVAVS